MNPEEIKEILTGKKIYKSTIEAFIQAKREIKAILNNTQAFDFKYANLVDTQNEVNRVLENKGLDLIEMRHVEIEHFSRDYTNNRGQEKTKYVSIGTATFIIGSIWDNERLTWQVPADFSNDKSEHDAVYSANSISYRYFLVRAFAIPTLDEDKARQNDSVDNLGTLNNKKILKDDNGNIIWQPTLSQINFFNLLIKDKLIKEQFKIEMNDAGFTNHKDYIIYKGAKWFSDWLGKNSKNNN